MIDRAEVDGATCLLAVAPLDRIAERGLEPAYLGLLSEEERARHDRIVLPRKKAEFLAARALVRTTLGALAGVDPRALQFEKGRWGKPFVVAPAAATSLAFNLSHTDGVVVGLFARDREIGVDVERVDRKTPTERLARRFFAEREADDVAAREGDERRERFFAYWTLKEAYIKARAMGLALPLAAFSFSPDDPIAIAFDARIADEPSSWQFGRAAISPRHRVAWAIRRRDEPDLTVIIREVVPLGA